MNGEKGTLPLPKQMRYGVLILVAFTFLLLNGCGQSPGGPSQVVQMNGLKVTLTGEFHSSTSEIGIRVTDAQGNPVDVGKMKLNMLMNMPGMSPMAASAEVSGSGGAYVARVKPGMAGKWVATLRYDGPRGSGETSFEVTVR